ncbi:MAG TPA: hypothetical protein VK203_11605 [Nostocaceae cyanobacterium]|nr:hypothetical protein [Nostocaceae cyanobacterium]
MIESKFVPHLPKTCCSSSKVEDKEAIAPRQIKSDRPNIRNLMP